MTYLRHLYLQKRREELELQSLEGAKREMLEKEIRAKEAQQVALSLPPLSLPPPPPPPLFLSCSLAMACESARACIYPCMHTCVLV